MPPVNFEDLRSVDREVLAAMRVGQCMGIGELTHQLGVTATAVRQRIDRLMGEGLIEREKVVAGRGRPTYCYRLTLTGHRVAGANSSDLADALWREVISLTDEKVRNEILSAVAKRLGRRHAEQADLPVLNHSDESAESRSSDSDDFKERLQKLSRSMSTQKIPMEVSNEGEIPVLDINACPYPSLTDQSEDRTMCRLEEQMISEALGQPMQLRSCRLDGDDCCQFSAVHSIGTAEPRCDLTTNTVN